VQVLDHDDAALLASGLQRQAVAGEYAAAARAGLKLGVRPGADVEQLE
jgi:hypothetical protein